MYQINALNKMYNIFKLFYKNVVCKLYFFPIMKQELIHILIFEIIQKIYIICEIKNPNIPFDDII